MPVISARSISTIFSEHFELHQLFRSDPAKAYYANFGGDVGDWYWNLRGWLKLLLDTVLIAYLGTLVGAAGAFLFAFFAAGNLAPSNVLRWGVKRIFEFCRTVPDLVFALMFVSAFGLGPLAGNPRDRHS